MIENRTFDEINVGDATNVKVTVAGHRVVFGGATYTAPTFLSDQVVAELDRLVPFFPLHLPHNLAAIRPLAPHLVARGPVVRPAG